GLALRRRQHRAADQEPAAGRMNLVGWVSVGHHARGRAQTSIRRVTTITSRCISLVGYASDRRLCSALASEADANPPYQPSFTSSRSSSRIGNSKKQDRLSFSSKNSTPIYSWPTQTSAESVLRGRATTRMFSLSNLRFR